MANTTYSFNDVKMVIKPLGYAAYTVNGQGIGKIEVNYADANSSQDRSADGSVMTNKIKANNGMCSITVQQTSPLNEYLIGLFNYLNLGATALWAQTRIDISSKLNLADSHALTGCSLEKRPNRSYEANGQMVTWNFLFTDGQGFGSTLANLSTQANIV